MANRMRTAARAPRRQWVEALRVVAAFGIVWYHAQIPTGHAVSYAGLSAFLAISLYSKGSAARPAA